MNEAYRKLFNLDLDSDYATRSLCERGQQLVVADEHGQRIPEEHWPSRRLLRGEVLTGANAVDIIVRALDGNRIWVSTTGAPIRGPDEQITGVVLVARDVTERRQLEQRTHEALAALLAMAEELVRGPNPGLNPATVEAAAVGDGERQPTVDMLTVPTMPAVALRLAELTRTALGCVRVSLHTVEPAALTVRALAVVGLPLEQQTQLWTATDG